MDKDACWNPGDSIVDRVDAHLLSNAYLRSEWKILTPLLAALHGNTSENFAWSLNYHDIFIRVLYRPKS